MTQHTPGPWEAVDNSWETSTIYDATGQEVARCYIDGKVDQDTQDKYEAIKEADARLIAAAPDLLEALQTLDAVLLKAWSIGNLPASVIERSVITQYRAAIAKATGAA